MTTTISSDSVLESIRIPSLPQSVDKIRRTLALPGVGIADIAAALAQDPPLAAKVLRLANSAQYGLREKTTSIPRAAAMLGVQTLESIVLSAGVMSIYATAKESEEFAVIEYWKHSILTACLCEEMAKCCRRRSTDLSPQDYYSLGLLHDLGRVMLYDNLGDEYLPVLRHAAQNRPGIEAEEMALFGMTHAEVGATAAILWQLPAPLPEMIRLHHHPETTGVDTDVLKLVACADELAHEIQRSPGREPGAIAGAVRTLPPGLPGSALVRLIPLAQQSLAACVI